MPVLPKYELKSLFESGDLITEDGMRDLIDSTYNPTLIAGNNITLSKIATPSGDQITISSTGGGGGTELTVTDGSTSVSQVDKMTFSGATVTDQGNGDAKITISPLSETEYYDEGLLVGSYGKVNFVGQDVFAQQNAGDPNMINVFVPTPTFASHFNTTDGTTTGTVGDNIATPTVRISSPITEGNPFNTNGWEGTNRPATISQSVTFSTAQQVTGLSEDLSGDSIVTVNVYDADGTSLLDTYTSPVLYQNGSNSSINGNITVTVSDYAQDTFKWKGKISVLCDIDNITTANGLDGGRYHVEIIHNTDTDTDGGLVFTYEQGDVFYDTNASTPSINGTMTIIESTTPSNILTKHLSGVEYYILNSEFEVDVTNIDNFNQNTQGFNNSTTKNFTITASDYGLPVRNIKAWSLSSGMSWNGTWSNLYNLQNADFEYTSWPITATNYRYRGAGANGTSQVFDPWNNGNIKLSPNRKILVDTFNPNSTRLGEDFDDEGERLVRGSTSYTSWDSTQPLGTSITLTAPTSSIGCDSCVVGSYLVRPDKFFLTDPNTNTLVGSDLPNYKPNKNGANPNYSTANYQNNSVYHRKFYTTGSNLSKPISNFIMSFSGSFGTSGNATNALSDENIKIYIRRVSIPSGGTGTSGFNANPLSLHGDLFNSGAPSNPYNDGSSGVDTLGSLIRTGSSSGNTVTATFGGDNATEGFWMELQIIDPNIKIDSINVTLTFTDGTTDSSPV